MSEGGQMTTTARPTTSSAGTKPRPKRESAELHRLSPITNRESRGTVTGPKSWLHDPAPAVRYGSSIGGPVDEHGPIVDLDGLAREADRALDVVLVLGLRDADPLAQPVEEPADHATVGRRGAVRVDEDDDVASSDVAGGVRELVDEDPIAAEQRRLHRLGRDVEGLDEEALDHDGDAERDEHEERHRAEEVPARIVRAPLPVVRRLSRPRRVSASRTPRGRRGLAGIAGSCLAYVPQLAGWRGLPVEHLDLDGLERGPDLDAFAQVQARDRGDGDPGDEGRLGREPHASAVALDRDRTHPAAEDVAAEPTGGSSDSVTSAGGTGRTPRRPRTPPATGR